MRSRWVFTVVARSSWSAVPVAAVSALGAECLAPDGAFGVHRNVGSGAVVLVHLWFLVAGVALLRRRS
jgi:hypothetical protein